MWAASASAKIDNGGLKVNQDCVLVNHHDPDKFRKIKIGKLYEFDGLKPRGGTAGRRGLHRGHLR